MVRDDSDGDFDAGTFNDTYRSGTGSSAKVKLQVGGFSRTTLGKIDYEPCESLDNWAEDSGYDSATLSIVTDYVKAGTYSIKHYQNQSGFGVWYRNHANQTGVFYYLFWVRLTSTARRWYFGSANTTRGASSSFAGPYIMMDGGYIYYYVGSSQYTISTITSGWHYIVLKMDVGNDTFDLWVDGVLKKSGGGFRYSKTNLDRFYTQGGLDTGDAARIDELSVSTSRTITVNGLSDGWYFKVLKGSNSYQSPPASSGSTSLDCATLNDPPPYDEIEIYDNNDNLILDGQFQNDIWAGDVYNYTAGASAGDFISQVHDLGEGINLPEGLSWGGSVPSGATLKFQLRAGHQSTLSGDFEGPTGPGDYFESSPAEVPSKWAGCRYIQYKAYLDKGSSQTGPELDWVEIAYRKYRGPIKLRF